MMQRAWGFEGVPTLMAGAVLGVEAG